MNIEFLREITNLQVSFIILIINNILVHIFIVYSETKSNIGVPHGSIKKPYYQKLIINKCEYTKF